jgi:hypothetical protein
MKKYSLWVCALLMSGYLAVTVLGGKWKKHTVIKSDAAGYYVYLTSFFVYNDPLKCRFYGQADSTYNFADGVFYYGVQYHPITQNFYFKYNYGVALLEAPFFFTAHAATLFCGEYPADGYSDYYQLSIALCTAVYAFLGLLVVRLFLLSYFTEAVVAVTLFVIGAGTNLFAQIVTQPGLSHVFMFFLFAVMLFASQRLYSVFTLKWFFVIGLAIGLTIVVRPIDIFVIVFPLIWLGRKYAKHVKAKPSSCIYLIVSLCPVFILVFFQLLYWKYTTDHWYFYTYKREYFDFCNWQIVNGLFSFRKGWLIYTPLALLGFAGCFPLWKKKHLRIYLTSFVIYFTLTLYITFCWWQWYYGGSFGSRVMVESYALLALPIGALFEDIFAAKKSIKVVTLFLTGLLILLNLYQTAQYAKGVIHWQKMNREYYWRIFGKWNVSNEDKRLLLKTEEIKQP